MKYANFFNELTEIENMVTNYINNQVNCTKKIQTQILENCALSYIKRGGKKLRPAVLMLSCLAVGGERQKAIAASTAVELFHTWTLVHDDIIHKLFPTSTKPNRNAFLILLQYVGRTV